MITIRNANSSYGMAVDFTAEDLPSAVAEMQDTIRMCGEEFADVVVTEDDYEIVESHEAKHTPGPWKAEHDNYGDEIWYGGNACGMWTIRGPNGCYMASCDNGSEAERARCEADARLIAAAPELLAVLREFVPPGSAAHDPTCPRVRHGDYESCNCRAGRARAAIAKAEGNH
jgi:hypothetical protein